MALNNTRKTADEVNGGPCWLRSNYPCNVNAVLYY